MKKHINWKTVSCLLVLCFCFGYVITRLIIKEMYVDAAFTAVIAKGCSDDLCMSFDVLFSGHVNH